MLGQLIAAKDRRAAEVAGDLGIDPSVLSRLMSRDRGAGPDLRRRMLVYFGVERDALFGDSAPSRRPLKPSPGRAGR